MKQIFIAVFYLLNFQSLAQSIEANASSWALSHNTSMRLIVGSGSKNTSVLSAAIEIKLAPHFKTYWRTPGDSGVPPQISFEGSENLKSAEVLFPAPRIFKDETGTTAGYKDHTIWPVRIKAQDISKPVILNVKLDYGVCEKICIPASGTAKINLNYGEKTEFDAQIAGAEALVPVKIKLGQGNDLSITKVSNPTIENNHAVFIVDIAGSQFVEILPEAKPESWYLEAHPVSPAGNQFKIIVFDPQQARKATPCDIRLTVMQKNKAIEVPVRLEGCIE